VTRRRDFTISDATHLRGAVHLIKMKFIFVLIKNFEEKVKKSLDKAKNF